MRTVSAPATETVSITVKGEYFVNEIPPRCRNPRDVLHVVDIPVEIQVVSEEAFPLAMTVTTRHRDTVFDYRSHGGILYLPVILRGESVTSDALDGAHVRGDDEESVIEGVHAAYSRYLIFDGSLWREVVTPRYAIQESRYSGVDLMVRTEDRTYHGDYLVFSALDFDTAVEHAKECARRFGHDESLEYLEREPETLRRIEVHVPESAQIDIPTVRDQRLMLLRAKYDAAAEEADRIREHIDALRTQESSKREEMVKIWSELSEHLPSPEDARA